MTAAVIIIAVIIIAPALFVAWCALNSPDGYEDERGFHEVKR